MRHNGRSFGPLVCIGFGNLYGNSINLDANSIPCNKRIVAASYKMGVGDLMITWAFENRTMQGHESMTIVLLSVVDKVIGA